MGAQILWTLALDGNITKSPNAVADLALRLANRGVRVETSRLSFIVKDLASPPYQALRRTVNGRRTVGLTLTHGALPENPFAGVAISDVAPSPEPEAIEPAPVVAPPSRRGRPPAAKTKTKTPNGPQAEAFEWPPVATAKRRLVAHVLWSLHLDGPVVSDTNATAVLIDRLRDRGQPIANHDRTAFGTLLRDLAGERWGHIIRRSGTATSTKLIELTLDPRLLPPDPAQPSSAPAEPPTAHVVATELEAYEPPVAPSPNGHHDDAPAATITDKLLFAVSLITEGVVQLAHQPPPDLDALLGARLGPALAAIEEASRLRTELDEERTRNAELQRTNRALQATVDQLATLRR